MRLPLCKSGVLLLILSAGCLDDIGTPYHILGTKVAVFAAIIALLAIALIFSLPRIRSLLFQTEIE